MDCPSYEIQVTDKWKDIEGATIKVTVIVIPMAASDTQFLLTGDLNEVRSLGWIGTEDGSIIWKYNPPSDLVRAEIEEKIKKLLWEDF